MRVQLLTDPVGLLALSIRPRKVIEAANLVLRRQLASYLEPRLPHRRVDGAARFNLALLSLLCDWRSTIVLVLPETIVRDSGWPQIAGPSTQRTSTASSLPV